MALLDVAQACVNANAISWTQKVFLFVSFCCPFVGSVRVVVTTASVLGWLMFLVLSNVETYKARKTPKRGPLCEGVSICDMATMYGNALVNTHTLRVGWVALKC